MPAVTARRSVPLSRQRDRTGALPVAPSENRVRELIQRRMSSRFNLRVALAAAVLPLVGPVLLTGAPSHQGMVECGAPHSVQESLFVRQQRLLHEPGLAQSLPAPNASATQSGEIALIEASGEVMAPPNPVDLSGRKISISSGPAGLTVATAGEDANVSIEDIGVPIDLDDDDFAVIELPFTFPYYGSDYSHGFVHSDGNFTFEFPEPSSLARNYSRAAGGPPRIAPLFRDLDPSKGGRVRLSIQGNRAILTWYQVPLYSDTGIGKRQTFRLELDADGTIEFLYGELDLPSAVVGTFPGVAEREAVAVDWSAPPSDSIQGEPILAEIFTDEGVLDEFGVVHSFFRSHEDAYDSLIVFNAIDVSASRFSLAHAYPVRNDIAGIGESIGDFGQFFGSPRRLSAFVNMGSVSGYPISPLAPIAGLPHSSLLTILAHEVGHRFLAYPTWMDPETGEPSFALLGRQLAHWSFFLHTEASVLEGNWITDHGTEASPRFETIQATDYYGPLDQYLMGLLDPSEVAATFLVEDPVAVGIGNKARSPEVGVTFDGIRKEVRIEDIIAAEGPRRPDASVSQRHFRHAFVLVVEDADSPDTAAVSKLQKLRTTWRAYFNAQLGTKATLATELVKMLHLSTWPAGGVVASKTGTGRITISEPRDTDLSVSLQLAEAIATVPATVTIPAGELFVEFTIRGLEAGPTTFTAEATESGYDRAVTKLYVAAGLDGLKLERLHYGELPGVAGSVLPWELAFRVRDENRLPYSGIELAFSQGNPAGQPIANAVTDFDGRVSVEWPLAAQSGTQLLKASLKDAPEILALTRASAAGLPPAFAASLVVNAASGNAPSSDRGFAPGSLVTIHGVGLAIEETDADTLLVMGNPSLPYSLGGTRVHVGGVAAPVVRATPTEVTFQIPFELEGTETNVRVATLHGRSESITIPLSALQPGLFPDRVGSVSTAPIFGTVATGGAASAGGLLEVYGTGLGAVTPTGRTGFPGSSLPPQSVDGETKAWVGSQELTVRSSALALFEAGVYKVVVELPDDLEAGMQELKIAIDGVESNTVTFESE